jgi:phosphoglycerate kinase
VVRVDAVPADQMILDIGPETASVFAEALRPMRGVVWNGPMGVFEIPAFAKGSMAIASVVASLNATTVVGGGETAQLVAQAGVAARITHVSTGGGASLEMLEGKPLPGVEALEDMPS